MIWRMSLASGGEKRPEFIGGFVSQKCSSSKITILTFPRALAITVGIHHRFLTSGPSADTGSSCQSSLRYSQKKNLNKLKITFLSTSENQVFRANFHTEIWRDRKIQRISQDLLTWSRGHWNCKLKRKTKWLFGKWLESEHRLAERERETLLRDTV